MLYALGLWLVILIICALIVIVLYKFGVVSILFNTTQYSSNEFIKKQCGIGVENNEGTAVKNTINDWKLSDNQLKNNILLQRECGIDEQN